MMEILTGTHREETKVKKRRTASVVFCVLLTICTIFTFLYYNDTAFSSEGMLMVIVPFSRMIEWISGRWFSLKSIAGLCYLLSLILSIVLITIAVLFFIGDKVLNKNLIRRIVKVTLIVLCSFYFFALIINIATVITLQGAVFYVYIITEMLKLVALVFLFGILHFQTKKI